MTFKIGDHLKVQRLGYTHHGIYRGNGTVIHYSGKANGILDRTGKIARVSLALFARGAAIKVVQHLNRKFDRATSVRRAERRIGEQAYNVYDNNCEHFVNDCIHGTHKSVQVDRGTITIGGGFATGAGIGGKVLATGRGGPAIMKTLKSAGKFAGGGAMRGVNVIAGVGALGGDALMSRTVLKDNPTLDNDERRARTIGRWSGRAAGFGATVGVSSAVASAATTTAAGGAVVTSGLAGMGGLVGGGMAAGVGLAVAGPLVLTIGAGFGAYKLAQHFGGGQPKRVSTARQLTSW